MKSVGQIKVKTDVRFTVNLFDDVQVIAGKTLLLMEENPAGDCLCIYQDTDNAPYLVDVDHRDVEIVKLPVTA